MNTQLATQLQAKTMPTVQELMAQIESLRKENEVLAKAKSVSTRNGLKLSEKGAVSLYGLGRFPVSLYAEQWKKIFSMKEEIMTFIADGERQGKILPKDAKIAVTA